MRQLVVPSVLALSLIVLVVILTTPTGPARATESGHNTKIYTEQGGATVVHESGATLQQDAGSAQNESGALTVMAGGSLAVDAGGKFTLPVTTSNVSVTVTAAQSGMTFVATAGDLVFTLPSTAAGLCYTFTQNTTAGSVGLSISPATADKIIGNGFTPLDNKDAINTKATARIGDSITLVGDGVDGWYVKSVSGTWDRE